MTEKNQKPPMDITRKIATITTHEDFNKMNDVEGLVALRQLLSEEAAPFNILNILSTSSTQEAE